MGLTNFNAALSGSQVTGPVFSGLGPMPTSSSVAPTGASIEPVLSPGTLPSVDWASVTNGVSGAPNLGFSMPQDAGASFLTNASDGAPISATTLAQQNLMNPSDPFLGASMVGGLTQNPLDPTAQAQAQQQAQSALDSLDQKISQLTAAGLPVPPELEQQMSAAQASLTALGAESAAAAASSGKTQYTDKPTIAGQNLNKSNKAKKTYDYGFPSGQSSIATTAQKQAAPGTDSNIVYSKIPFIPTLTHQSLIWQSEGPQDKPILGIRKSQAIASRMSFKLEYRNIIMSLLINPKSLNIVRSQVLSNAGVRTGFIVNPTGPGEFDINISGTTAAFYDEGGLTSVETFSVAYSNLLLLYNFFLNNGYVLDDEPDTFADTPNKVFATRLEAPNPAQKKAPSKRINSMSYVVIEYQKWIWSGYFKTFKIRDTAETPYSLAFDFTFRVCHESDMFKIDSSADVETPAVSGHVTSGYSAERNVAAQAMGDITADDPLAINGNEVTHRLARLWSFDDPTSPVPVALDPTKSHAQAASDLAAGGFPGEDTVGPDGSRTYTGQSEDGTALSMSSSGNTRSVTVAQPDSSPVNYTNTAEQKDPDTISGTMQVSPGGDQYTYETPGTVAPPTTAPDPAKLKELQDQLAALVATRQQLSATQMAAEQAVRTAESNYRSTNSATYYLTDAQAAAMFPGQNLYQAIQNYQANLLAHDPTVAAARQAANDAAAVVQANFAQQGEITKQIDQLQGH